MVECQYPNESLENEVHAQFGRLLPPAENLRDLAMNFIAGSPGNTYGPSRAKTGRTDGFAQLESPCDSP